jgi:hypothetical protein
MEVSMSTIRTRILEALVVAAGLNLAAGLYLCLCAQDFPRITYELQAGSRIRDECLPCVGPINWVEEPLAGSFTLQRLPVKIVGELYALEGLDLQSQNPEPAGQYQVQGAGQFHLVNPETQRVSLTLQVNNTADVILTNSVEKVEALWPTVQFEVTEDGTRELVHRYTIWIVAKPKLAMVAYTLVPMSAVPEDGSYLLDDCTGCLAPPAAPVPIEGTLRLGLLEGDPAGLGEVKYFVDSMSFRSLGGFASYEIGGIGSWTRSNFSGVPPRQQGSAVVDINADTGVLLTSPEGPVPQDAYGTGIDIVLKRENPQLDERSYTLHILAKLMEPQGRPFRRGDSNEDGEVNISDAVYSLLWLFSSGTAPRCLDTADADANGVAELTDAVFLLMYLFQGGSPPPAPGPANCGEPLGPGLGCGVYPAC